MAPRHLGNWRHSRSKVKTAITTISKAFSKLLFIIFSFLYRLLHLLVFFALFLNLPIVSYKRMILLDLLAISANLTRYYSKFYY